MIAAEQVAYTVRAYQPDDEESVLRLLEICLPSETSRWDSPTLWRWKHRQNPFGPSYVLVAQADDGEIIGVRALMRWKFSNAGSTFCAVRPVDTATHPSLRRAGIFANLTNRAMAELQAEGVPLVFNTPNPMSMPGYIKMGWAPIGTVRPLVKLVNPVKCFAKMALARVTGGQDGGNNTPGPAEDSMALGRLLSHPALDSLIEQDSQLNDSQLSTERTKEYLQWRYQEHPSLKYLALTEEKDGRLAGSVIGRSYTSRGLRGLIIEELLLSRPEPEIVAGLLSKAVQTVSADVLTAYFNPYSCQHNLLRNSGFRQDMRKKVNVVMRELNPVPGPNPRLAQTWGLSMGDLEFL